MNYLSANVAQKLKSFVRWMTHEDRPYELHDDFLATLTRERYLKFRHMDTHSFSASSPSHHEPCKHQVKKRPQRKTFFFQQEEISDDDKNTNEEEKFPMIQNQSNILHIQLISYQFNPTCHKSLSYLPTSRKHLLRAPNK